MKILGISALYHDAAAALVVDGLIVAAAQEERFTRKKHDEAIPLRSVEFCLRQAGLKLSEIDHIAFYDKPFLKFERLLETYLSTAPRGFESFRRALPIWIKEKLFQKDLLVNEIAELDPLLGKNAIRDKLLFSEHHLSHAASAFFPSPFEEAAVLTMDGVGEWTTTSLAIGKENTLRIEKEIHFPHSLGLLYSAFTYFTGFKVNSGEYKLMGLAPYGIPRFKDLILETLVDLKADGSFRLNQKFFNYATGLTMTNEKFASLFRIPRRSPEEKLEQIHMDIAASVQAVTEEAVIRLARGARENTGLKNLCLAGGVALNCVANGRLQREGIFENIWVQPAAGDAGGALGAALAAHHLHAKLQRMPRAPGRDAMNGSYLGTAYSLSDIENQLQAAGANYRILPEQEMIRESAQLLANGKALGWMQGRMEFGPRALGARSILADARDTSMQSNLNLKVKFRESFRPFAPAVLKEKAAEWFQFAGLSPYMLMVANVKEDHLLPAAPESAGLVGVERLKVPRSKIPAVTHVDNSARLQTVDAATNPLFHALLSEFDAQTGCPVLVNTSFNVRGEPIVESPTDAFRCFMGTDIDALVIGNCLLLKSEQNPALKKDYKESFTLD